MLFEFTRTYTCKMLIVFSIFNFLYFCWCHGIFSNFRAVSAYFKRKIKEKFDFMVKKQNQLINLSALKLFLWRWYHKLIIMFMQAKDLIFPLVNFLFDLDHFWKKTMQKCSYVQILKNFLFYQADFEEGKNLKFALELKFFLSIPYSS